MANKRIDMLKVRKTLQLLVSGTSSRQISRRLKMGRHTVSDYLTRFSATGLSYADLLSLDDHTLNTLLFPPQAVPTISSRQQDLQSRLPRIALELKRKGVTK